MPAISAEAIRALSVQETAARVAAGELAAEAVTRAFAEKIAAEEPEVEAWTFFDAERALGEAHRVAGGPLAGVTFGVKDVIDTADMPTTYGSPAYPDVQPAWDAPCVELARAAGAVMLGKTVSTEFAMTSPGKTRNPVNGGHTPGGSSSGSCAAVARDMAQVAFGTQTIGSIIRPSSFCGVVGYKPTYGTLNRTAVKVLSDSLDTLGLITRSVRDAAYAAAVLAERPDFTVPETPAAPRVGLFRTSRWHLAEPATVAAIEGAAAALKAQGLVVEEVQVPDWFDAAIDTADALMGWEAPRSLAYERRVLADQITANTRAFLDVLAKVPLERYLAAKAFLATRAARMEELLDGFDVLLTPAAPGEAPETLASTGNGVFNKGWTALHAPCVTLPGGRGPKGLPVGVQLVGRLGDDAGVLAAAAFVEAALAASRRA